LILLDLELEQRGGKSSLDNDLVSAFSSDAEPNLRLGPLGTVGRTLERGLDCVVAVWEREGPEESRVVEVVKDRVGNTLGAWGLWE
jgi:hypothetical protein